MNTRNSVLGILAILVSASMACAAQTLIPTSGLDFPSFPPTPGGNQKTTGSSPMSGDWVASAEFGRFAFTIDPQGQNITTAVVEMSGYTCGGTTLTTEEQTLNVWPINAGRFAGNIDLNPDHIEYLSFSGAYSAARKGFSGTWEEDAYGTHCSGTWQTPARK